MFNNLHMTDLAISVGILVNKDITSKDAKHSSSLIFLSAMLSINSYEFLTVYPLSPTSGDKIFVKKFGKIVKW